jgi:hypothetical protein
LICKIEPALTPHFEYPVTIKYRIFFNLKKLEMIPWYKKILNENLPLSSLADAAGYSRFMAEAEAATVKTISGAV